MYRELEHRNDSYAGLERVLVFLAAFFFATFFLVAAFFGAAFLAAFFATFFLATFFLATFFFVAAAFFLATDHILRKAKLGCCRDIVQKQEGDGLGSTTDTKNLHRNRFDFDIVTKTTLSRLRH